MLINALLTVWWCSFFSSWCSVRFLHSCVVGFSNVQGRSHHISQSSDFDHKLVFPFQYYFLASSVAGPIFRHETCFGLRLPSISAPGPNIIHMNDTCSFQWILFTLLALILLLVKAPIIWLLTKSVIWFGGYMRYYYVQNQGALLLKRDMPLCINNYHLKTNPYKEMNRLINSRICLHVSAINVRHPPTLWLCWPFFSILSLATVMYYFLAMFPLSFCRKISLIPICSFF